MEAKPLILHAHIPRTGGVSLNAIMQRNFREDFIVLHKGARMFNDEELRALAIIFYKMRCVSSHHISGPIPQPNHPNVRLLPISFVRHPVARSISEYLFSKNNVQRGISKKNVDFSSFETWFHSANETSYAQTGGAIRTNKNLQSTIICRGGDENAVLETALNNFFFIGINERFDESLLVLRNKLKKIGIMLDIHYRIHNASPSRMGQEDATTLRARAEDLILSYNHMDMTLYEYMNRQLDTEIELQGESFHKDLSKLRRSQHVLAALAPAARIIRRASRLQMSVIDRTIGRLDL